MITKATLAFLAELKTHNDRSWFEEHKKEYKAAYADFFDTVAHLLGGVCSFDHEIAMSGLDPKSCIMRINRDIRFSKDKSPYKTNFFFFINREGKKSPFGGYYFHLEPGASFGGGGIYMPEPVALEKVRREIEQHFDEWQDVVSGKKFSSDFPGGVLPSGQLSRPPKGFDASSPAIEYLKYKGYYTQRFFSDKEVISAGFADELLEVFRTVQPLVGFINRSLSNEDSG
ncbi:MAG: DUF2461 domain-containing protein, partial [Chlorobiaceae bacterium]|nr:DUF2461 domain-containing protein [Chlorobiaceae bacterium]